MMSTENDFSKVLIPPIQIHNSQGNMTDSESLRRTSKRQEKAPITRSNDFFMATEIVDSPKNLSSNQPSNNISEQAYNLQLLTNPNTNKIFSIHRHEVTNKNGDLNNLLKIYHQNIRGLKGKTNKFMLPLLTVAPHLICRLNFFFFL